MFELSLLQKYEGRLMLSGNPVEVCAIVTPTLDFYSSTNVYVLVSVSVQSTPGSAVYNTIKTQKVIPTNQGIIKFDIGSIAEAYLKYFIPPANLDNKVFCREQAKNFVVTMDLYNLNNNNTKESTITDTVRILKGGASYEYFLPFIGELLYNDEEHYLFMSTLSPNNSNLTETVFASDYFFLNLLIPTNINNPWQYYIDYQVDYLDVDNTVKTATGALHAPIPADFEARVWCLPGGFDQNKLNTKIPAGATPISYYLDIYYFVGTDKIRRNFEKVVFTLEQRNFYNTRQLLYRNSLGSLMPLRIKGTIENEAAYDSQTTNIVPLSWLKDKNVVGNIQQGRSTEDYKFKGETGFISKFEADRVRDFFLSDERYEYRDSRLVPIVVNSKNVKYYSNNDSLYTIAIEWQDAFTNRFYTQFDIASKSCPAMLNFYWKQSLNPNIINIYYWLPPGYDFFRVTVEFPGEAPQYYFIEGNTGVSSLTLVRPDSATGSVEIVVKGNVMCNRYNKLPSFGPVFTTVAQTLDAVASLVANADTFNILPGITTPTVLSPSVLINDYDPGGSPIEVVAVTNVATTEGGTISIAADGTVTYTPPSSGFTGTDSYVYSIRKVGGVTVKTATISINVTPAATSAIWAGIYDTDLTYVGAGEFFYNKHYIALFNSPLQLTSVTASLTVNYKKRVTTSSSINDYMTSTFVETYHTAVFDNMYWYLLFIGNPEVYTFNPVTLITKKEVTTFQVLPGTGYNVQ